MGRAPMPMTPLYKNSTRAYVFEIHTPPIPWPLRFGWRIIAATILIGATLIHFVH